MTVEDLRHVFKTLADPTRMRLLLLLEREELAVHELVAIVDLAQSTVSRHLAILRDAGLLRDRREGTAIYYRLVASEDAAWREVWRATKRALARETQFVRDRTELAKILEARTLRTKSWFDHVAPEWDSLRRVFNDDIHRALAINRLVPGDMWVADIGTGTGILARELAAAGLRVIAVDHSRRMLDAARAKFEAAGVEIDLRQGDAGSLPIGDGEVQAAFAHMVLHYIASPADAVREMARIVGAGGRVVIVDFVQHDREWMRDRLGVQWQGFPIETIRDWLLLAGLTDVRIAVDEPANKSHDIPATFIASASKPSITNPR